MEPTGPAQLPMGQLAPTSKTLVDSGQLSVQPVQDEEMRQASPWLACLEEDGRPGLR